MSLLSQSPPRFLTLAFMTSLSVLSFNMIAPSLSAIAQDFDASYAQTSIAVSGFLAVNAALFLVLGPASDRFGRRPVILWATAVFVVASIGAALAQSLWIFLIFRTLQAAIAAGSVVSAAMVRDVYGAEDAASRLGYLAMAMAIAPMLGPSVGGILDQIFGWRAIFWVYAGLGLALFALCYWDAGETNTQRHSTFAHQLRAYPDLLKNRMFWAYAGVMSCGIGAFYVFVAGAPFVGTDILGLSPAVLGLGIGSITLGFFAGSFLAGQLSRRMGTARMILLGRSVPVAGIGIVLLAYSLGLFHPFLIFVAAITAGVGNGMTTPSARAGSMSVRQDLAGSASGLGGALIVAIGAALTQVTGAVLTANNGIAMLLGLMLLLSGIGLYLAGVIWRADRKTTDESDA